MRLILLLLVMVLAVIFSAQNATAVTIDLFVWRIDVSLAVVIALCFAIGVIAGILFAVPALYRMRTHRRRLQAQLADLGADDVSRPDATAGSVPREPPRGSH